MGKIRVVIADDSSLARELLRSFLEGESDMEVVGEACNGLQAVELVRTLKPHIITMDLEMPVMTGLEAIEAIMCSKAVPILVVSSVADARNALAAVGNGALEVIKKPDFSAEEASEFVAKVRLLAGVTVFTRMRPRPASAMPPQMAMTPTLGPVTRPVNMSLEPCRLAAVSTSYSRIFAIACSTGGPQALAQILPALPANFPCPVVIAQHISDGFAGGMAQWLSGLCKLPVRLAVDGEPISAGVIYLSPSEQNFSISPTRQVRLLERLPGEVFRPNCDVLLNAVAEVFGAQAVGIILTGMSSDGAKGTARIRDKGGKTLAQNESTSVIFGMNRVAIEAGAVQQVLPVEAIAAEMIALAGVAP